jgi:tetratricopeptide (TPR) repeat protein
MESGALVDSRFEVQCLVGEGGMAKVYRAREVATGRLVALKILREPKAGRVARFAREGAVLSRMEHPHIVRYLAQGNSSGSAWLAMEWLEGESLETRLRRGPLSIADSIALVRGAAEALAFAHDRGVLHRDIKPGNLFLPGGRCEDVKVLDFGIARVEDATITRTGAMIGTPAYVSPEQARAAELDARSDLFSLGCVFYECLTGRRAFDGPNPVAVLTKVLFHRPSAPRVLEARIPAALSDLVEHLMEKNASARPGSADEMVALLDHIPGAEGGGREQHGALTHRELKLLTVVLAAGAANQSQASWLQGFEERSQAKAEWLADGSLAVVFSGQRSATDQAMLAARCALEIRRGLESGTISVATGRGTLQGALPTGEVIDRAASLLRTVSDEESGEASSIVIDEVTLALLDTRFDVVRDERGAVLCGERAHAEPSRNLFGKPSPYVGRERELAGLQGIFSECISEPAPRAALVSGPPGYGKSRLRKEFLNGLGIVSPRATVYLARGDPMSAGSPFQMISQLVAQAAGIRPDDSPELRRSRLRERLGSQLAPADSTRVVEFLGELVGAAFPEETSVQLRSARQDRMLMADQLLRAFEDWAVSESSTGPVILVLEDLHWGDVPSVRFIDSALRAAEDRPLFVLALARPEIRELWPSLWSERGLQEIRLGKLSRRAGERLVRAVVREDLAPAELEGLVEAADGNVFFLEELIRAEAAGSTDKRPPSVLAMVTMRLEALEPFSRRLVRCASLFGERFSLAGVLAVIGVEHAERVRAALVDLVDQEIVTGRGDRSAGAEPSYAFRHALLRDAAYAMLPDPDRALGHRLVGQWLAGNVDADALAVAEHFEKGGAPERAVDWYHRAALGALHGNDLPGAVARVDRAVACGASGDTLVSLHLIAAEAHNWESRFAEARAPALKAYGAAPPGSPARDEAMTNLAIQSTHVGDLAMVVKLARELLASTEPQSAVSRGKTCSWVTLNLLTSGERELALRIVPLLEACTKSAGGDLPLLEGFVETAKSLLAQFDGDVVSSVSHLERAAGAFERVADLRNAFDCKGNLALRALFLGDAAAAERWGREVIAAGERLELRNLVSNGQYTLAMALAMQGSLDEAIALEREALAFYVASGSRMMSATAYGYLATILLQSGDPIGAEHEALAAVASASGNPQLEAGANAVLAQTLLAQGRMEEALQPSRSAHRALDDLGSLEEREILVRLVYAEALAATGDTQSARRTLAAARERVLEFASRIPDVEMRERFLGAVPENARVLQLASEWIGTPIRSE